MNATRRRRRKKMNEKRKKTTSVAKKKRRSALKKRKSVKLRRRKRTGVNSKLRLLVLAVKSMLRATCNRRMNSLRTLPANEDGPRSYSVPGNLLRVL